MGPMVYHPYSRRQESLTVCRCLYKGSTFSSDSECWSSWGLNQKPTAQQTGAYPNELTPGKILSCKNIIHSSSIIIFKNRFQEHIKIDLG